MKLLLLLDFDGRKVDGPCFVSVHRSKRSELGPEEICLFGFVNNFI